MAFAGSLLLLPEGGSTGPVWLVAALAALAVASEIAGTRFAVRFQLTGSESCYLLAMVVAGTAAGAAIALAVCLAGWLVERYRVQALVVNLAGFVTPVAVAGATFHAMVPDPGAGGAGFVGALLLAVLVASVGNGVIVLTLMAVLDGASLRRTALSARSLLPALGFQVAFIVSTVASYVELGGAALAFVVVVNLAFAYMYRLVIRARDRTREYADLSWGLLSGLIRTLDARDARAARHCAAVAKFSRDIAAASGMGRREQDLAHTAGLLHDIGRFALSDRVMDRGTQLRPDDWKAIRRHPELGADLLQDLGVYGPVAAIVRAHHERPDGRGYPDGLTAEEIPAIAKIVAVAEVYDTLTAPDTYRSPMTSFEALNELRRVAGSQLDPVYVECLAGLMAGQGTAYRHLGDADFAAELDIERRINDAARS
ncbi:HD domain-containing protein [Conexibacter sp. W3-3-2]|uniref:HD-GYP domain-containing protein n=1 Tax=Conexibacter sp. W3-3-2 TaxID=2675227 RepID=UPI0012B78EFE|nr:HD domain-containing phosphohydrolase [Conexibacter sp. W3-3-2]MTD45701.1 HD domain-containing protein [Conexibacter sp. W3-3-2]